MLSHPRRKLHDGIFASGKDRSSIGQPLHTDFKLSSRGEYLALTQTDPSEPNGIFVATAFIDVAFPNTVDDVSYGIGQNVTVDSVVAADDASRLLFPTNGNLGAAWTASGFDDSAWQLGTNAIGYEQSIPGLTVEDAKSNGQINSISTALSLLSGSNQASKSTAIVPYIDLFDTGGTGNYGDNLPFPNNTGGDDNDFAIRATGTIVIPETGTWTFGTNSDDGARLRIDGSNVINDDSLHAPQNRFGQRTLTAGTHSIELIFFERGGGAEVELFAAKGSFSSFNASAFRRIGDVDNGGLVVETVPTAGTSTSGYSQVISTDTGSEMIGVTPGAYMRIPFVSLNTPESLSLRMRYDDGFIAYLNGTEVARRNAPTNASHNSIALTNRFDNDGLLIEDIDITNHIGLLDNGANTLAVHAMNDEIDSDEFLAIAELAEVTVQNLDNLYFTSPSPGAFNSNAGVDGFLIDEIQLSHPHGIYDNAFSLTIDTVTDGTTVRYTTNGTEPTASNGTLYAGPINVNGTRTIRARAFKDGLEPSNVETATYIFIDDVISQSPNGERPTGWPTPNTSQALDYGMDSTIVNSGTWGPQLEQALKQVPSMSIVMDIDDFIGSSNGIYTHAGNHGKNWERPISLELINPDDSPGFQIDAGLRIRGGFSRSNSNPKHSFRLFFRDEYGDGKLNFPLFEGEGVDEFEKFDLRTTQNYSWAFGGSTRNAFVRDVFSRDIQGQMGHPYTRSRFYHLYINGQYWGLYQTEERPEARFAASYMGGDAEDYDVVKSAGSSGGHANEATDGTMDAYGRLSDYFYQAGGIGDSKLADYWKSQGMNPDGSRNPDFERLLDVDNLIDYMILTYYTSDADGPGSKFTRPRVNNYFTIYNRDNPDGFKFFEHDSEHSLDTGNAAGANYNMVTPLTTGGSQFRYFNPHWMHEQLANSNSEYQQRFADRVYEVMFNDGLLTSDHAKAIIDSRASEFDMAIIAESARWGDAKQSSPRTKNDWQNAINSVRNFIDNRIPVVLGQLRGVGWYPDTNAPVFTVNGAPMNNGELETTDQIELLSANTATFSNIVFSNSTWKYLDDGSDQGTAWRASNFNDASWKSGASELGYGDNNEQTVISFGPNSGDKFRTSYFRKSFNVNDVSQYQSLRIRLQRDDGAIVYLNGNEIVRSNMPGGTVGHDDFAAGVVGGGDESTFFEFDVDINELENGTNVLAVEVHQANSGSSDLSFDLELQGALLGATDGTVYYTLDGSDPRLPGGTANGSATIYDGNPFSLNSTAIAKARVLKNNEWSPLAEGTYLVDVPAAAGNLTVTELNYNPHDALTQFGDADVNNDQFEFVELKNIGDNRIDLTEVKFVAADNGGDSQGIEFTFGTQTLDPGEHIVVVRDRVAFASRYGNGVRIAEASGVAVGSGVFDGSLSNGGELLTIVDRDGTIIQQFEYNDGGSWPGRADGNASSLEVRDTTGDYDSSSNWRNSNEFGGSPGMPGTGSIDDLVINEVLTHTDLPQIDAIELHNVSDAAVSVAGWYLSDNNSNYLKHQVSIVQGAIPSGGYLTIDETSLGFGFKGQESDDAWLIAADVTGKPMRFADHVEFSAAQNGVSLGRWPNGTGSLFPMTSATFDSTNAGPVVEDVVISEVHYSPAMPPEGSGLSVAELEFVEVWNGGGATISIENWRLNRAIDFEFATGQTLLANGRVAIVSFDPSAEPGKATEFRAIHGVDASVLLLGPFTGSLDNGGEKLELDRPEDVTQLGLGYVLIDRVDYDNDAPWPLNADGQGQSLNRTSATSFGNFVASWQAATPTPGSITGEANASPVANADSYNLNEGATINVAAPGVLANDTDSDGDSLSAVIVSQPTNGSLTLNVDGSFTYQHNGGETTTDSFEYRASDGNGGTATATVSINIAPQNDSPVAHGDSYAVNEGAVVTVDTPGVLANDTDEEAESLTASIVQQPQFGTLTLNANGSFSYEHDGSETTSDSFVYQVSDGNGGMDTATVGISINGVNDDPIAVNDVYEVAEGLLLTIDALGLLANDTDDDGDLLTTTLRTNPTHGSATVNGDGSFSYQHDGGESTSDTFTYVAGDGLGGTAIGTVSISITPVNDRPVANDDTYSVGEGATLNIATPGVLSNDSDPDGDELSVALVNGPQNGTLTLNANGSFNYAHNGGESVSDSFIYEATDGGLTTTATVTISIDSTNDAPVATNDTYSVNEGATLNIAAAGLLSNDSDPDGDALSATLRTQAANGTVAIGSDGSFSYEHDGSESTSDTFTYFVSDGRGANAFGTVSLTISPTNDLPDASDDSYSVESGDTLTVAAPGVLANDTDIENDSLTVEVVSGPSVGSLSLSENGSFVYTHDGVDTDAVPFTYRVLDGNGGSDEATVTISVIESQVLGDFNDDDAVTIEDVDLLCGAIRRGETDLLYDVDGSGNITENDFATLISGVIGTTVGDSNLDGVFNSTDLIVVFQRNEYEDSIVGNSTWGDGDWTCDGEFDSGDLVAAFQLGDYVANAIPQTTDNRVAAAKVGENIADQRSPGESTKTFHESINRLHEYPIEMLESRDSLFATQVDWKHFDNENAADDVDATEDVFLP